MIVRTFTVEIPGEPPVRFKSNPVPGIDAKSDGFAPVYQEAGSVIQRWRLEEFLHAAFKDRDEADQTIWIDVVYREFGGEAEYITHQPLIYSPHLRRIDFGSPEPLPRVAAPEVDAQKATRKRRLEHHQRWVKAKLENPKEFGFVGVYTFPTRPVEIPWGDLNEFLTRHRSHFSSELSYSGQPERLQNAVSVGYFPRAVRQEIKSTHRTTLYTDGLVALDSQADTAMDRASRGLGKILHPYWLSYQLQRHLQLSRAVLEPWNVDRADLVVEFENIEEFSVGFHGSSSIVDTSPYSGFHLPIERELNISEVYKYDGDRRNIAMPDVKNIMEEVCRIFGDAQPPGLWDEDGYLTYVKGAENTR